MHDKHQIVEEPCEVKVSRMVLKTSGAGDSLAEFNNLISAIEYKLQEAGGFLVKVPTKTVKPSQTCPDCGHQRKKDLSERVHNCLECDATYDRDVAAAMVMLSWALGTSVLFPWRGSHYFQSPAYGRMEANGLDETSETRRSTFVTASSS